MMVEYAYSPMRSASKEVSEAKLNEILVRRGGKPINVDVAQRVERRPEVNVLQAVEPQPGSKAVGANPSVNFVNGGSAESPTLGEGVVSTADQECGPSKASPGTATPAASSESETLRSQNADQTCPQGTGPTLKWLAPVGEGRRTECGRYSVCRITSGTVTRYELWKLVPDANWFRCLRNNLDSFKTAAKLAQEDANR